MQCPVGKLLWEIKDWLQATHCGLKRLHGKPGDCNRGGSKWSALIH